MDGDKTIVKTIEQKKQAALKRFFRLQKLRLIKHDWSKSNETGLVKMIYPLDKNSPCDGES